MQSRRSACNLTPTTTLTTFAMEPNDANNADEAKNDDAANDNDGEAMVPDDAGDDQEPSRRREPFLLLWRPLYHSRLLAKLPAAGHAVAVTKPFSSHLHLRRLHRCTPPPSTSNLQCLLYASPRSYRQAMADPVAPAWLRAAEASRGLDAYQTWSVVEKPANLAWCAVRPSMHEPVWPTPVLLVQGG